MRRQNRKSILRALLSVVLLSLVMAGAVSAQNTSKFRVRLTAPISSDGTKGSRIAGQVVSPPEVAGAILEGRITQAKSTGGLRPSSELGFKFETMYHQGRSYPIDGQVTGYYNSKGLQNTDDEGHIIKNSNKPVTTAVVATGVGAAIGAILAGGNKPDKPAQNNAKDTKKPTTNDPSKNKANNSGNSRLDGAAAGAAVGALAGLALGMTADAPRITFDTGSEFELDVKTPRSTTSRAR